MRDWLITFAVGAESRPFRRRLDRLPGVNVLETGMGPVAARKALDRELARQRPELVISSGFAGGLRPELRTGDVVFDSAADEALAGSLPAAGAQPGRFVSSPRVLARARDKAALHEQSHADAVDMESAAISTACRQQGVPCAILRIISDAADEDLPLDFGGLVGVDGRISWWRLGLALASSPARIPALFRFQRRIQRVADRLATVLEAAITAARTRSR